MKNLINKTGSFENLLADLRSLQPWVKSPQTFLQITRFPHYELVCSNILKFFLNPCEEHHLGDLFLRSLLEIYDLKAKTNFSKKVLQFNEIEREEITEAGKYIDIMILAEPILVGIENKMHAPANYNPYAEYSEHLGKVAMGRKVPLENIVKIILGLKHYGDGKDERFYSITFEEYFNQVSTNLGQKILKCEQRYLVFLIDFMNTINNQQKDFQMDKELCKFLQEGGREAATAQFYVRLKQLVDLFRSKVEIVSEKISAPSNFSGPVFWGSPKNAKGDEKEIYDSIIFTRLTNHVEIKVQASIGIRGWQIAAYSPSGNWNWSKPETIRDSLGFDESEDEVATECKKLLEIIAKL